MQKRGGYWAEVPALEGCFAQGETLEEAIADAREAIRAHLETLREEGGEPEDEEIIIATVRMPEASPA